MVSTPSKTDPQCAQHLLDPRFGSVFDLCAAMAEHPGPVGTGTGGRSDRDAGGRFFNFAVTPEKILDPPLCYRLPEGLPARLLSLQLLTSGGWPVLDKDPRDLMRIVKVPCRMAVPITALCDAAASTCPAGRCSRL